MLCSSYIKRKDLKKITLRLLCVIQDEKRNLVFSFYFRQTKQLQWTFESHFCFLRPVVFFFSECSTCTCLVVLYGPARLWVICTINLVYKLRCPAVLGEAKSYKLYEFFLFHTSGTWRSCDGSPGVWTAVYNLSACVGLPGYFDKPSVYMFAVEEVNFKHSIVS